MLDTIQSVRQHLHAQIDMLEEEKLSDLMTFVAFLRYQSLAMNENRHSVLDVLDAAPGLQLFKSAKEVDDYIAQERDSWA